MRLLVLVVLLAGAGWAATNEEGKTLLVRAAAMIGMVPPVIELDIASVSRGLKQADVEGSFKDVRFRCGPESGGLGDTVCDSPASLVNGMPAYGVAFFFVRGSVSSVRVALQAKSSDRLEAYLKEQFPVGEWRTETLPSGKPLRVLSAPGGRLMTSEETSSLDELVVLWVPR